MSSSETRRLALQHVDVRIELEAQMAATAMADHSAAASSREIKLDPEPTAVRAARHFIQSALSELGFPGCVDDGLLVVSELVTNAIRAAPQTPCLVVVRVDAGHPIIEVHDGSAEPPKRREPDFDALHGRGLHVVDTLCVRWDCVRSGSGKAVIARLAPK
jgi:anti-sigma regulatory factor (Ser/Thr protein kinase)